MLTRRWEQASGQVRHKSVGTKILFFRRRRRQLSCRADGRVAVLRYLVAMRIEAASVVRTFC